jgi:chromosome segregation ATPase
MLKNIKIHILNLMDTISEDEIKRKNMDNQVVDLKAEILKLFCRVDCVTEEKKRLEKENMELRFVKEKQKSKLSKYEKKVKLFQNKLTILEKRLEEAEEEREGCMMEKWCDKKNIENLEKHMKIMKNKMVFLEEELGKEKNSFDEARRSKEVFETIKHDMELTLRCKNEQITSLVCNFLLRKCFFFLEHFNFCL